MEKANNLKVIEFKNVNDVKDTIKDFERFTDELDGVILIGLKKDGSQMLRTSSMSGYEKAYLSQFLNAFIYNSFQIERDKT